MIERRTAIKWIAVLTAFWFALGFDFGLTGNPYILPFGPLGTYVVWRYLRTHAVPANQLEFAFAKTLEYQNANDGTPFASIVLGLAERKPHLESSLTRIYLLYSWRDLKAAIKKLQRVVSREDKDALLALARGQPRFPQTCREFRAQRIDSPFIMALVYAALFESEDQTEPEEEETDSSEFAALPGRSDEGSGGSPMVH